MIIVDRRPNPQGKSLPNRQRFLTRVKAQVRRAVADSIDRRRISDVGADEEVKVRVLHSAVHAEFRLRRSGSLFRALARPWTLRPRHARQAVAILHNLAVLPLLRWQLRQLAQGAGKTPPMSGLGLPGAVTQHQDA